jgi:hypothetical protein
MFWFRRNNWTICPLNTTLNLSYLMFNQEWYLLWPKLTYGNIGICVLRKIEDEDWNTTCWAILCPGYHSGLMYLHHITSMRRFRRWEVMDLRFELCLQLSMPKIVLGNHSNCGGCVCNKFLARERSSCHYLPGPERCEVWEWLPKALQAMCAVGHWD